MANWGEKSSIGAFENGLTKFGSKCGSVGVDFSLNFSIWGFPGRFKLLGSI